MCRNYEPCTGLKLFPKDVRAYITSTFLSLSCLNLSFKQCKSSTSVAILNLVLVFSISQQLGAARRLHSVLVILVRLRGSHVAGHCPSTYTPLGYLIFTGVVCLVAPRTRLKGGF